MNACEMNALITAITNHLYCKLSPRDFNYLTVFVSELSKSMFSIAIMRGICELEERREHHREHHREREKDRDKEEEETDQEDEAGEE